MRIIEILLIIKQCTTKVHNKLFFGGEKLLQKILNKIGEEGICMDRYLLSKIKRDAEKTLEKIKNVISTLDCDLDPESPQKVRQVLFDKLMLPPGPTTPKGKSSTDTRVLGLFLQSGIPEVKYLIRYRATSNLLSSCKRLEESLDKDGKSHPTYSLDSITARAYSKNPDIQKIPKDLRKVIVPDKGKVFISSDYSQIDVRILAHFSQDPSLLEIFWQGKDIYSEIARVLGVRRDLAKKICLSVLYGRKEWALSQDLSISQKEAAWYINKFYEKYSGVKKFIENINRQAKKKGYVVSLAGREIPVEPCEDIRKKAIARKIQASTADIFLQGALVNLFEIFDGKKTRVVFHVHDELVLETPVESAESTEKLLREVMESSWQLEVPLKVKTKIGYRWG